MGLYNAGKYALSFGAVLDQLQEGQIAEYEGGGYIVKRRGEFFHGTDVNARLAVAASYLQAKWRITPFFEDRVCSCGCEALLRPLSEAYDQGKLAERYHGAYYDFTHEGKATIGLFEGRKDG